MGVFILIYGYFVVCCKNIIQNAKKKVVSVKFTHDFKT